MKRLLVMGASGLLGWSVCAAARQQWLVVGVVNRHAVALPGVSQLLCDLTRFDALPGLFRRVAPDAVIHSPAEITAACPITVTSSRWPRAFIRRTQNPFSSLW